MLARFERGEGIFYQTLGGEYSSENRLRPALHSLPPISPQILRRQCGARFPTAVQRWPSPVRAEVRTFEDWPLTTDWTTDCQVALITGNDGWTIPARAAAVPHLPRIQAANVQHNQNQIGVSQRFHRFTNTDGFRFVESLPDSSGVDQLDGNAADGDSLAHQVARGSRGRP